MEPDLIQAATHPLQSQTIRPTLSFISHGRNFVKNIHQYEQKLPAVERDHLHGREKTLNRYLIDTQL
jgi:hypothetical protein